MLPTPYGSPKLSNAAKREAAKRDTVKIAAHVRYGAAALLLLPRCRKAILEWSG
jgi:hypothetical protein